MDQPPFGLEKRLSTKCTKNMKQKSEGNWAALDDLVISKLSSQSALPLQSVWQFPCRPIEVLRSDHAAFFDAEVAFEEAGAERFGGDVEGEAAEGFDEAEG